ncbi:hypothetical protein [Cupriavidus necator]|uniref:alpha/beta fold hydrolase n=1 Tax=Cupriavidus necator TaxID=106590 RepID=UPI00339D8483
MLAVGVDQVERRLGRVLIGIEELISARRAAITRCLDRAATPELVEEYLSPWRDARVARSWMALAGADNRYTQALVPALRASATPKLLAWGEDDPFQRIEHAERFAREMPDTGWCVSRAPVISLRKTTRPR